MGDDNLGVSGPLYPCVARGKKNVLNFHSCSPTLQPCYRLHQPPSVPTKTDTTRYTGLSQCISGYTVTLAVYCCSNPHPMSALHSRHPRPPETLHSHSPLPPSKPPSSTLHSNNHAPRVVVLGHAHCPPSKVMEVERDMPAVESGSRLSRLRRATRQTRRGLPSRWRGAGDLALRPAQGRCASVPQSVVACASVATPPDLQCESCP